MKPPQTTLWLSTIGWYRQAMPRLIPARGRSGLTGRSPRDRLRHHRPTLLHPGSVDSCPFGPPSCLARDNVEPRPKLAMALIPLHGWQKTDSPCAHDLKTGFLLRSAACFAHIRRVARDETFKSKAPPSCPSCSASTS